MKQEQKLADQIIRNMKETGLTPDNMLEVIKAAKERLSESKKPITERVKSFEDACIVLGIESILPDCSKLPEKHQKSIIAYYKLVTIVEALNEGWIPDFTNEDQSKWWCWTYTGSYAGLFFLHVSASATSRIAVLGARLCFKSKTLAEYFGAQFEELYKEYLLHK